MNLTQINRSEKKLTSIYEIINSHFKLFALVLIIILTIWAWAHRFVSDDFFISLRYAENLVNGNGLVWNPGERVEGITNFLWTLILCFPLYLGIEPIKFANFAGIIFFAGTLTLSLITAKKILGSGLLSLLTVIFLGTNFTFYHYATSGLETQFQTFLFIMLMLLTFKFMEGEDTKVSQYLLFSIFFTAAIMTRLDSIVVAGPLFILSVLSLKHIKCSKKQKLKYLTTLIVPAILLLCSWMAWKLSYYGDILPNTFYAKTDSNITFGTGLFYLRIFATSYLLWPIILVLLMSIKAVISERKKKLALLFFMVIFWCTYIVYIGGDFMEFRFLVPIMPFLTILITWGIVVFIKKRVFQVTLILLVFAGYIHHATTFKYSEGISKIKSMVQNLYSPDQAWVQIGKQLGKTIKTSSGVSIAVSPAGAIPYYSKLFAVDMFGMNDAWIPQYGIKAHIRPGHLCFAPFEYLLARRINIVIAHPQMKPRNEAPKNIYTFKEVTKIGFLIIKNKNNIPQSAKILEIPINERFKLVTLYLTPHPAVDLAIKENGWKLYPIQI